MLGALCLIFVVDLTLFSEIAAGPSGAAAYFLPVGEGDSELLILKSGVKILIDGGPPGPAASAALGYVLGPHDRYIDVVVLTHPQLDHYGGLIDVVKEYDIGVFVSNGMGTDVAAYGDLKKALARSSAEQVVLEYGDAIRSGGDIVKVMSPDGGTLAAGVLNDAALVLAAETGGIRSVFTSDIGVDVERAILARFGETTNVLKVAHHGSKYSSSPEFLGALRPQIAVIEVGRNSYGHPAPEVLDRLASIGAVFFRTDQDGLVKVSANAGALTISKLGL